MTILVNHVGYSPDADRLHRAVLQTRSDEAFPPTVKLVDAEGGFVAEYATGEPVTVSGWTKRRFAVVDFLPPVGGPYRLSAGEAWISTDFEVGEDLIPKTIISDLLFGLHAGRSSGFSDRADRSLPFFGDRSGRVDLHGGWYDASGDTSKYLSHLNYANFMNPQQTPLVCWALMDSMEHLVRSRFPLGKRLKLRFLEEIIWGADFLLRMQDAQGYFYVTVFDQWSKNLNQRCIATFRGEEGLLADDYPAAYRQGGGMAIAALARASALVPEGGHYRDAAIRGWRHLEDHNREYLNDGEENIIDDTCALMAAAELLAVGFDDAATALSVRSLSLVERWNAAGGFFRADEAGAWSWFHASDEALPLIAMMRARELGGGDGAGEIDAVIDAALDAEIGREGSVANPFRHPRRVVMMPKRKRREQFFYPHSNPSGYWWQGENARLASWALACRRRVFGTGVGRRPLGNDARRSYLSFADAQESWILGLNPFDACMLQGRGRNNPDYDWDHFNIPGAVVNGITSGFYDEDDIAFQPREAMKSGNHSWRWGEQWIPHAAWLLLASAWSVA